MDAQHRYSIASTTNVNGPMGHLIKAVELSQFAHSYIVLADRICEAAPGGVRFRALEEWTGAGKTVYSSATVDLTTTQQDALELWCEAQIGKRYDYFGDFIVGLDALWLRSAKRHDEEFRAVETWLDKDDRWFCSAMADAGMSAAGVKLFDDGRPFHAVSPANLAARLIDLGNVPEIAGVPQNVTLRA